MHLIWLLPLLIWGVAVTTTILGTLYSLRRFRRSEKPNELPPISILKPLKGIERGMYENLISFFELRYPNFEILFSVSDERDPVVPLVRKLMAAHPEIKTRLIVGSVAIGPNPKVNNLVISYEQAENDVLLISDSNVRAAKDYLQRVVSHFKPDVGIVTAVVRGMGHDGWGGRLESIYLNSFYARWMHVSAFLGFPCVVGKSMLFRRSVAERFGGLKVLGRYIAEDYMAGQAMLRLGLRVEIMTEPVEQFIGEYGLNDFWKRHMRWGRIRKAQAPLAFCVEPFVACMVSGLLGGYAAHSIWNVNGFSVFCLHVLTWAFCDFILMRRLGDKISPKWILGWLLRECLATPMWLSMAAGNTVSWRGNILRIRRGGVVTAI